MQVVKCPRCDINFMREGEACCKICQRDLKGMALKESEPEMCAECGENPALPGEDICADCLKERKLLHDEPRKTNVKRKPEVVSDDEDDLPLDENEEPIEEDDIETGELEELDIDLSIGEEEDVEIDELPDEDLVDLDDVEADEFDAEDALDDCKDESARAELLSWEDRDRNVRAR